jgi:hypothetical protein
VTALACGERHRAGNRGRSDCRRDHAMARACREPGISNRGCRGSGHGQSSRARGISERSLTEILAIVRAARPERWTPREDDWIAVQVRELTANQPELTPETLRRALHVRLALCAATGALALLAIAVASSIPPRNKARAAFAKTVLFYIGSWFVVLAARGPLSAVAGAWCPNVLAVILAGGIWSLSVVRRGPSSG